MPPPFWLGIRRNADMMLPVNEETFYPAGSDDALEWIAVLCAADLDYRLSRDTGRAWLLHVPAEQAAVAWAELCAFENERRNPPPPPPAAVARSSASKAAPADAAPLWTVFWAAYALAVFYLWTGPYDGTVPLFQAGCADAGKIMTGQWWRNITALTLHSSLPHLLANVFFILAVGQAVVHAFGRGLGLMLMLGGGILGNAAAAYTSGPGQVSVGASTLCFAALGIMSTRQTTVAFRRWRRLRAVWKRIWLPMASGLALLGMMGAGEQSDLAAHAFGFAAGAVLALPFCTPSTPPHLSPPTQWTLTVLAVLLPLIGWALAMLA